jgi:hypothetical protein
MTEFFAATGRIDSAGRADHADSYAGVQVGETGEIVVHRVPSPAFDELVRQVAGDTPVRIRDAEHTLAELTALQERITADLPFWQARGIAISTVGARHDGSGVEVGTPDLDAARAALPEHYGDAPVLLVRRGPVYPLGDQ